MKKKINEKFGECSGFFYIKRPINIESHMFKVTSTIAAHLRAAIGLRTALRSFLLYQNSSLFTYGNRGCGVFKGEVQN